jgi:thioredoxin-like negative regulator of GroEL
MTLSPLPVDGAAEVEQKVERPRLVFFYSHTSGPSRRAEGFLSQVLQRRQNHDRFNLYRVDVREHAELARQFGIRDLPTLVVVEGKRVEAQLVKPRGCREIERLLRPWLR